MGRFDRVEVGTGERGWTIFSHLASYDLCVYPEIARLPVLNFRKGFDRNDYGARVHV